MIIPDGHAVERLAIRMAAAIGIVWQRCTDEQARNFRMAAHAALMDAYLSRQEVGARLLADQLTEAVLAMRQAARHLDNMKASEDVIERAYRGATSIEAVARILGVTAEEQEAEEADEVI